MIRALAVALLGGLLLGGIIHIAIIFFAPTFAANDGWARISAVTSENRFRLLPAPKPDEARFPDLDPQVAHAACRFDLSENPVRITADIPADFWSMAVFDRRGRNIFSINDRSTEGRALDLIVITPVQMALVRQNPPEDLEQAIIVERRIEEAFILFRALAADPTDRADIEAALVAATCRQGL